MIDTHCHLEMSQFDEDREAVIERARAAGVELMLTIGSDLEGCEGGVALAEKYDFIYATVGLHAHDAKDLDEKTYRRLTELASHPKVVAIGETGLDYHYDYSPRDIQKAAFRRQLHLAKECRLPVIIHCREAAEDTLAILTESGLHSGIMHCFSGDRELARRVLDMGLHISIAGPVTFKKSEMLREVAKMVPDDRLLVETDAPYLAPDPLRGKRNEPAYVMHTAQCIAQLRGITLEDLDRMTTLNAKKLFGIGVADEGRIAYKIRDSLYLNITNRCSNRCSFCIRYSSDFVKGHNLKLDREPTVDELKHAIGNPAAFSEIVFCGYGEPTLRLDVVKEIAAWVKQCGGRVRINTNGHGSAINGRNIAPELAGLVDALSVSLDAQDAETYNRICEPSVDNAFMAVTDFLREAGRYVPDVTATVIEMDGVDVAKCRTLAETLGVKLRVRKLDIVG